MGCGFLVVHPPLVLVHELGHAVVAEKFGVLVRTINWEFYAGYVQLGGYVSPDEHWWISLAGNLADGVVGVLLIVAGYFLRRLNPMVRYFLVVAGVAELIFTLVWYPFLSFRDRFGDWLVIYDFGATPGHSSVALVLHAAALIGLIEWWRRGRLEGILFLDGDLPDDESTYYQ